MLILSRNRNETIVIGDDVRVTVLDIQTRESSLDLASVRLGIQAPRDVAVHRQEIFDRIHSQRSGGGGVKSKPKKGLPGKREIIRDAVVRLRIQTPPGVNVQCSRAAADAAAPQRLDLSIGHDAEGSPPAGGPRNLVVECRKEDHFLIGSQFVVVIVDVGRYIIDRAPR